MPFNEDTRVKLPALVHLTRLGFTYIPGSQWKYESESNIFLEIFKDGICKINNQNYSDHDMKKFIRDIHLDLSNNDLGRAFYRRLTTNIDCKLIDFEKPENNSFHVVTELTCQNENEEFRPDITILINGLPLAFIEVKKPNNRDGILAERKRINDRYKNPKFKKFMNITQLLVFSNNMPYDDESTEPILGAFYGTPTPDGVLFNPFREEDESIIENISPIDETKEIEILKDNNKVTILGTNEYNTNIQITTPTNRILSSLFTKSRILFLLKYGFAYVTKIDPTGNRREKHIMRYPQIFASKAITTKLDNGIKKGIIWHTQGSGKTALAYFNVFYLRDYFQKKNVITKFYFIVDRLDLAEQSKNEFESRGLKVEMVSSREDFKKNIKTPGVTTRNAGDQTITVVNIQKLSEESVAENSDYEINTQRIYFLDEVHRSYSPKGSFLKNLLTTDKNSILIGLTGTPLITTEYKSKEIFGDYFHKYYYNKSIVDGYTLKLIREGIETKFRNQVKDTLKEIETLEGSLNPREVFAHPKFIEPLVQYIVNDFNKSRILHNDTSIGAMIVCDSSDQAKNIYQELTSKFGEKIDDKIAGTSIFYDTPEPIIDLAADSQQARILEFKDKSKRPLRAAIILHDVDTKVIRKDSQSDFKAGDIDILVVYNMLLTGFDAPRLKKLYLTRVIREHNLLQTLTRVNRPYKSFKYGYVVDFADIRSEFEKTNKEYFKELQEEIGEDELQNYSNLFKSTEEIELEIQEIKDKLFSYDFSNLEDFQKSISEITNKAEIYVLRKCLENLKNLYNIIQIMDYKELKEKFEFDKINKILAEVNNRISILNLQDTLNNKTDNTQLLNLALEQMKFSFKKIAEHELIIADKLRDELVKTRNEFVSSFDKKDKNFISLLEELGRIFKAKHIEELDANEMNIVIQNLQDIFNRVHDLNNYNQRIAVKYKNDRKYARTHKRLAEKNFTEFNRETILHETLLDIKHQIDDKILDNRDIMRNQPFFSEAVKGVIMNTLEKKGIRNMEIVKLITAILVEEYNEERVAG